MTADTITVVTTVNAPLAQVWRAYTDPAHIMQWNFASDEWHCPHAESDLRVGGAFSYRMEARDGSSGFDFYGTFTEIVPESRIAYDFGDRHATITFLPEGDAVKVAVTFDPETEYPLDMQRDGWQAILDNFARHVHGG